jgi:hypothetical protein
VFTNQHGAPSAASPRRVKRAVAAKQRRLNTACNPGFLKDFTFGLTSNFFHASLGLLPRSLDTFKSQLWEAGNPCRILPVFVISFQNTRANIGQLESPSLTAFDPLRWMQ